MSKLEDVKTFGRDNEYIIELIVNDGDYNSESDYVTITIVAQNTAPVIESIDQISVNIVH